jgi:hypothetical protein
MPEFTDKLAAAPTETTTAAAACMGREVSH